MKQLISGILIIVISIFQFACASFAQQQIHKQIEFERKPFRKSPYKIKQPRKVDRKSEYGESYDPMPRVVTIDAEKGKYEFRWIGFDGKEKIVPYQRHDSIDAVVAADVKKGQDGRFIYNYDLRILPESDTYFSSFKVQTFGSSSEVIKLNKELFIFLRVGSFGQFKDGIWWNWGYIGDREQRINGGNSVEFHLSSTGLPGISNSRLTGGPLATKGVGESLPPELEDEIPYLADLARGYTIGPDERLSRFSEAEKIKYVLENLPKFQEAGWMSEGTAKNYQQLLKKKDMSRVFEKAKRDFGNEHISSEVFHIIEGLSR